MTAAVLDASALLALLLDEPGAALVESILPDSAISTVNLGEVIGHFARRGIEIGAIHQIVDPLPMDRVDFDQSLAFVTGGLLPISRPLGLSFGDRACLALAIRLGLPALTADRSWVQLPAVDSLTVKLIR